MPWILRGNDEAGGIIIPVLKAKKNQPKLVFYFQALRISLC